MRTFEFKDGKSNKFWNIELSAVAFTVTFGKIGTAGQSLEKTFSTGPAARCAHDKLVAGKLAKGYVETTAGTAVTRSASAKALENAILANPDDLGAHAAYADWLIEQGDPRGEFIQVQLALEDPKKSAKERKELQKREKQLLKKHEDAWLGELAVYLREGVARSTEDLRDELIEQGVELLLDPVRFGDSEHEVNYQHQFARGWLDGLQIPKLSLSFSQRLARAQQARLLRRLVIEGSYEGERGFLDPLLKARWLGQVRVFQLGQNQGDDWNNYRNYCHPESAPELVRRMPRLEELYLFARSYDTKALFKTRLDSLRVLQVYHMDSYPLELLARNKSLGKLTHLLCHPHFHHDHYMGAGPGDDVPDAYIRLDGVRAIVRSPELKSLTHLQLRVSDMGDAGCQEIVDSGVLRRLKLLDLRHGRFTDAGAEILAGCPDLQNLEHLDVDRNGLTKNGIQMLQKVLGKRVRADNQQTAHELAGGEYLCEGESE